MKEFRKTKEGLFVCEECNKTFDTCQGIGNHLGRKHNKKEYYDKWLKEENEGICPICGKEAKFNNLNKGYRNCCSKECYIKYTYQQTEIGCLKIFGVKNAMQNNIIVQQGKQTKKEKYGDENFNNREKFKETMLLKYDNENFNNREKFKETMLLKYGVENAQQNKEIQEKTKQTCLEKYGVEYVLQSQEIHKKQQMSGFKAKQYKDSKIYYRGTYELDFLEKHHDIFPDIQNGPSINYFFEDKNKIYIPDFFIQSLNFIIEIKSSYYYKKYKDKCDAKEKATIANGFKYIMIIDKDYSNMPKLDNPKFS